MEQKIPKILHYVWVGGGKMSDMMLRCIESWKKFCPDYEIIEWNENKFDANENPWVKLALKEKNWSLVSDIMRAWILYNYGGIYLDTDVEILKPLDDFLVHEFFTGYESKRWVNTAVVGSVKGHEIVKRCLSRFDGKSKECKIDSMTNLYAVHAYSAVIEMLYGIKPNGKTKVFENGIALYARDYFFPQHYLTYKIKITPNSHAIHRYACTWHSKNQQKTLNTLRRLRRIVGKHIFEFFEGKIARGYHKKLRKEFK